jgi:hypothetical protein
MASSMTSTRWSLRFGKDKRKDMAHDFRQAQEVEMAKSILIGRNHYVFAVDWRLYTRQRDLSRTMRNLQRQGYSHCVTTAPDMAGFASGVDRKIRQKPHSAALHLSETASNGGVEMFVFRITDRLYSLTVLSDAKPVPHFDQVGTFEEVMSLIQEYQTLQSGQSIRYVSNIDKIEGVESLDKLALNEAFGQPVSETALLTLPNYQLRLLLALVLVPASLLFLGGGYWFYTQQQEADKRRQAQMQDPNLAYEQKIDAALQQIGPFAPELLDRWRATIGQLPVSHVGWRLDKISCQLDACTASWLRESGSFNDFKSHPPPGISGMSSSQPGESPAQALIETTFPVVIADAQRQWKRSDLPDSEQAAMSLASQLQDIALLKEAEVKLKPAELFPSTGAVAAQLARPVVRGEWSIQHELWSLGDLRLQLPAQAVQSLTIKLDEKTRNWVYTLTGHYYAKGKNY